MQGDSNLILSPADFRRVLEEALYDARRFADAYPTIDRYRSTAQALAQLLRTTADLHRPTDEEKSVAEAMAPVLQCTDPRGADADLMRRCERILAYIVEWPIAAATAQTSELIPAVGDMPVDEIVAQVHRLISQVKKERIAVKAEAKAGSTLALGTREASRAVEKEMGEVLEAIADWIETGIPCADHSARPDPILQMPEYLGHYLPNQAEAIVRVRRAFSQWRVRGSRPEAAVQVAGFDDLVEALHRAEMAAGELRKIAPDDQAIQQLCASARALKATLRQWVLELNLPTDRHTPIAGQLSQSLDLLPWPQLGGVLRGVKILTDLWINLTADSLALFRKTLYETAIDVQLLQIVSASTGLDDVARCIEQLLYCTADGKTPRPHERADIRLADAYRRELAMYASDALGTFVASLSAASAYWIRRQPPVVKAQNDAASSVPMVSISRHEAERRMFVTVQEGRESWSPPYVEGTLPADAFDPIAQAKSLTHDYFLHLLESSLRTIDTLPMKHPFARGLAMQLRAIRRAVARQGGPADADRQTIGRGFAALSRLMPETHSPADNATINDAWAVHLHFQFTQQMPSQSKPAAPAGMIADDQHYKHELTDAIFDSAALVVLFPNSDVWLDAYRQLQRLCQEVSFGRDLDGAERIDIERALSSPPAPPAEFFGNVPHFATDYVERMRRIHNYHHGQRIGTREEFDELLRAVSAETLEILAGRNWDEDQPLLAQIDRQLRAMRRWTAGGRHATAEERSATQTALAGVEKLRGLDRMSDWAKRVRELAAAFEEDLPQGARTATPRSDDSVSVDAFGILLDECIRDCRSLGNVGKLFHKPSTGEIPWAEAAKQLAVIRRMLDQGRVPSRREREAIHSAITSFDATRPTPVETIHDFLPDIIDRLARVAAYYAWLVTAGPYAGKEAGNIEDAVTCVVLGGEMRVAFARTSGTEAGIYVCRAEKMVHRASAGGIEMDLMRYLPSTRDLLRLVPSDGWRRSEIRWNAHSDLLAYRIDGASPRVGWAQSRSPGERGSVAANAFAWASKGSSLLAIDLGGRWLFRVNAETGERKNLASLPDDVALTFTPHILVAPGGEYLVYTYGRSSGAVALCVVEFAGNQPVGRIRKTFEDAAGIFPFWPPGGGIGCLVNRRSGSEILKMPMSQGEGDMILRLESVAGPAAPSFSATGKYLSFYRGLADGNFELVMLDCDSQEFVSLLPVGTECGRLAFGEETLVIDGADTATVLWPRVSHEHRPVERF